MKRTLILVLCATVTALAAQAQQLKIVRPDGYIDPYALSEIGAITFREPAATGLAALSGGTAATYDLLRVHSGAGTTIFSTVRVDSITFGADVMTIHRTGGGPASFDLADVDSLTFASASDYPITVAYSGTSVTVTNPLASIGVTVAVTGADAIVTSTAGLPDITCVLSGTTTDGMFKVYADAGFTLTLDGVQITNANGPAINIQAHEPAIVQLSAGTTSTLTDGVTYASAPAGEDQKSAFFSEGELIFCGTGHLTVNGRGTSQNGLGSDDDIVVQGGTIVVASAVKDGIHTNVGYSQSAGSVQVTSQSDGIDAGDGPVNITGGALTISTPAADKSAVKSGGLLRIGGGTVNLTVAGNQSKGLKATNILLTGGAVTIQTSGGVVLAASGLGYDPSYCTAVKADSLVRVDGCGLSITTTGTAGRGISCDGDLMIVSGSVQIVSSGGGGTYTDPTGVIDAYHGPCLNADRNLTLSGGTITLSHSGSAGKGISGDANLTIGTVSSSPTLQVTTTGTPISLGSGEYAEAKAVSVDSVATVDNGTITIASADDAIKSKYRVNINGGLITVTNSVEGFEAPNLYITGGEIHITSSDDGINATYGNDIEANDGSILNISGGYVHVNAPTGDGIDSNGNLTLSGGTIIVHGPPSQPEVGLDVNGTFLVSGGFTVVAQINSNMVETPGGSSTQRSVLLKTTTTIAANTIFRIQDTSGNDIVTFKPARNYSSILVSSAAFTAGTTYRVYTGGTCTGTLRDGLYTGGTYAPGTLKTSFTSTSMVQTVNF